jgi:hypothetical protein
VPIVRRDNPRQVIGILSRSDLLTAHAPRLKEAREVRRVRSIVPTVFADRADHT